VNRIASRYVPVIAALLLLAFWAQAAGNLYDQSPVVDEPTHIARAQAYWRTGDFRLQRGHPPLIHALSGAFLQLEPGLPSPADLSGWTTTDRMSVAWHFLWGAGQPADRIIFLARFPVLTLALCLGAVLFRWGRQRLGLWPALGALFLFAFDPNLLAHSVLITTDMAATFFIFLAAYALDCWTIKCDWQHAAAAGVAVGLALTAKFSAIILAPVVLVIATLLAWRTRAWKTILIALIVMGVAAAIVIGIVYHFELGPLQPDGPTIPIPSFWRGLLAIEAHNRAGHPAFLFGQISPDGWWYYFIIAFLLKTPLPTLILALIGLVALGKFQISNFKFQISSLQSPLACCPARPLARWRKPGQAGRARGQAISNTIAPAWIIVLALYFAASLYTSLNVGYRHVLPMLPLVMLIAARPISNLPSLINLKTLHILRLALYALFAWYIINAAFIYPHHLAYFNELIGGPDGGYRALIDSNLDWGQDTRRLKRYLDANGIQQSYLIMFAGSPPEYYGIDSRPLPGPYQSPTTYDFHRFQPSPGVYVIGASSLQGLRLDDPDTYDVFRRQAPIARVGHTLFVYRIDEHPPLEKWVATCYTIDGPIDGDSIEAAFGRNDLRKVFYDCEKGWIYPAGEAPGWYIIPSIGERPKEAARFLQNSTEVFHERGYIQQEPYSVYHLPTTDHRPPTTELFTPYEARIGPAKLLGYMTDKISVQAGQTARVTSFWQAEETGQTLLSILAHLGGPNGLIATGDGLAVPAEVWLPGDIIAQTHDFAIPPETPPGDYTLYLGMYSVVSGEREPAYLDGQAVADGRIPVGLLHVTE